MITLTDISYRYPGTTEGWALENINLTVHDGEFVLICGGSGSGKSTLGYVFNGLVPHFFGGDLGGRAEVDGIDTRKVSVASLLPRVGLVLQNTDAHLFCSTVENEIAFGLESLAFPGPEIQRRVFWIAEMLGIQDLLDRSPQGLSGGERRLVAIASVLCLNPSVLLLDEPFAHLDWKGMGRVRKVLVDLHRSGKTIVVIEQRVAGLIREASRCVIMEQGKICFEGTMAQALSVLKERRLLPVYPQRLEKAEKSGEPMIVMRNLSHEREGRQILRDISLEVKAGETVAIVGRNGSGKTTLIRHLNGLRRPKKGAVSVMGMPVQGKSPLEMASLVGISFQNPNDQFFKNHVREELAAGPRALGKSDATLGQISDLFGLQSLLDRSPYRLSEGQKRRVALASVLAMNPRILVIDEPTVGQDGRFLETIAGLITSLRDKGCTVLVVTHDLEFALAVSDRWVVLHEGRKVGDGKPEELMKDGELIRMGAVGTEAGWSFTGEEASVALP
jgi:energy-coupling factor transporter ATP-binding protein EcfA2